jgi:DNA-directed RNA polymerase specialized sigma24 family protein
LNRQTKKSLESSIPKRSPKQKILCEAIERNHQSLENTIQMYVTSVLKNFGNTFDLSCDRNSIQTIATEILQNTVETVLRKSEEFDLNQSPFPWIKGIAVNQVKGWQRDKTRSSKKVVSIDKFSALTNNLSEKKILKIVYQSSQLSHTEF